MSKRSRTRIQWRSRTQTAPLSSDNEWTEFCVIDCEGDGQAAVNLIIWALDLKQYRRVNPKKVPAQKPGEPDTEPITDAMVLTAELMEFRIG